MTHVQVGAGSGTGAAKRIYGSTKPDQNKIFSAPQHWEKKQIEKADLVVKIHDLLGLVLG